jgi:hypothetical protein
MKNASPNYYSTSLLPPRGHFALSCAAKCSYTEITTFRQLPNSATELIQHSPFPSENWTVSGFLVRCEGDHIGCTVIFDSSRKSLCLVTQRNSPAGLGIGRNGVENRLYLNNGTANPFFGVSGKNVSDDSVQMTSIVIADMNGEGDFLLYGITLS